MTYVRKGLAQRLALELEARAWANGKGLSSQQRENEAWRELSAQLFRMEKRIAELEASPLP